MGETFDKEERCHCIYWSSTFLGKNDKIVNTSFIIMSAYMGVNKLYIFAFSKDVKKPMSLYVY